MSGDLAFRAATKADLLAAARNFCDSIKVAFTAGLIQMADWNDIMVPQAIKMFTRPGASVIVAAKPDEEAPYDMYGWIATEAGHPWPYVTYCYVKQSYRRQGLATALFEKAGIDPREAFRHATWIPREPWDMAAKVPCAKWSPLTVRFERREQNGRQERPPERRTGPRARTH